MTCECKTAKEGDVEVVTQACATHDLMVLARVKAIQEHYREAYRSAEQRALSDLRLGYAQRAEGIIAGITELANKMRWS